MNAAANSPALYQRVLRPLLFALPAERAHHAAIAALRLVSGSPFLLAQFERLFEAPAEPIRLFGLSFPNRVGLAAGFDKDGLAIPALAALGFGFVEIGTVTAQPQPGNPRPRIFRYPAQKALINRLGFNNEGADKMAHRLRGLMRAHRWPTVPIGINLGKSKSTPVEEAPDDYRYSFKRLAPMASYVVLNVSSPNTPGLRTLQATENLIELLKVIREENFLLVRPILVKIAPDLEEPDVRDIVAVCERMSVAGIIATNTTLDHSAITTAGRRDQEGGLSGAPLRDRATALVRLIRSLSNLPIIASGGVMSAADAQEKFEAGAQLVQLYTGLIYRGPGLIREIIAATRTRKEGYGT